MFIASTQGLVKIHGLDVISSASVVSVHQRMGQSLISSGYTDFVDKHTGIIKTLFGEENFHLTLSQEIDQGDSWQLAVYIAHWLHASGRLAVGNVEEGEEMIIATGRLDPQTKRTMSIKHLSQKCFRASHQLSQVYHHAHLSCFFIPLENYRQPVPDTNVVLSPIGDIQDLAKFFQHMGIEGPIDTALSLTKDMQNEVEAANVEIVAEASSAVLNYKSIGVCVLLLLFSVLFFLSSLHQSLLIEKRIGLNGCVNPETSELAISIEQVGTFPPIYSQGLCGIEFEFPRAVQSLVFVTSEGILQQATRVNSTRWSLPLQNGLVDTDEYILILSEYMLDEADFQSLQQQMMGQSDIAQKKLALTQWSNAQNHPIKVINQRFL